MIQEWDRYSPSKICLPPAAIDLEYEDKTLYVKLAYDDEKIKDLNEEIKEKLILGQELNVVFERLGQDDE